MKKLSKFIIIIVVILIIRVAAHSKIISIKGNILYGTSEKCSIMEITTTDITYRICELCYKIFEGSSSDIICHNCAEITNRCYVCGKIKDDEIIILPFLEKYKDKY